MKYSILTLLRHNVKFRAEFGGVVRERSNSASVGKRGPDRAARPSEHGNAFPPCESRKRLTIFQARAARAG